MKKSIEAADLKHFLDRLFQIDGFVPDRVDRSERPDFILTTQGKQIGVEATRLVYQEYMRALKLQAAKFPLSWINLTNCVDDGPRRTKDDLAKRILSGSQKWRPVESSVLGWLGKLARILGEKRDKQNREGYRNFNEDWLLIYDVCPPGINRWNYEFAVGRLFDVFSQPCGLPKDFSAVFSFRMISCFVGVTEISIARDLRTQSRFICPDSLEKSIPARRRLILGARFCQTWF